MNNLALDPFKIAQISGGETAMDRNNITQTDLIKTYRLEDYSIGRVNDSFEQVFKLRRVYVVIRPVEDL